MPDYLIVYDITDNRRRGRICRYLKGIGAHIQYSGFLVRADPRAITRHMIELAATIDPAEDDLRCYPLPARGLTLRMGRALLPEGVYWSGLAETSYP